MSAAAVTNTTAATATTASAPSIIDAAVLSTIDNLQKTDYSSEENQKTIKSLLDKLPSLESCGGDANAKVQVLVAKSRLKLLLVGSSSSSSGSSASADELLKQHLKDAESDISKALKLRSQDTSAWLVMSEIQWRRKSYREARDAAESALRSAPSNVQALCQASRLSRIVSSHEKAAEKKPALIANSIQRAKQALAVDPSSSEAWLCLGLTLYHEAGSTAMTFAGLRKALSAVAQACRCDPKNADAFLNRGLIEHSLTQFADALVSFETASKLDASLKAQCDPFFKRSQTMLMMLQQRLRIPVADRPKMLGEEFKAALKSAHAASLSPPAGAILTGLSSAFAPVIEVAKKAPASSSNATQVKASADASKAAAPNVDNDDDAKKPKACVVGVLRMISSSNEVPLVYECVDQGKNLCCLAVCNVSPAAIDLRYANKRPSVTFTIPPAEVALLQQTPQVPPEQFTTEIQKTLARIDGGLHPLHVIFCDVNSILINAKPVAPEHVVAATIAAEAL